MSDGFDVRPAELTAAAAPFDETAVQLRRVFDGLTTALQAEGACWGDGDAGRAFGHGYVPSALSAIMTLDDTQTGFDSLAATICTWAQAYVASEHEATTHYADLPRTDG